MKTKIRYAKVLHLEGEPEVTAGGHTDMFIVPEMLTDKIIKVTQRKERGWYVGRVNGNDWNYHCSWLRFVKKPTKVTK